MLDLRERQRSWIAALLRAKGLTATELARSAKLNASTLTRFMNDPEHPHALSAATIDAIAAATGVRAYDPPTPIIGGFAEEDAAAYDAELPGEDEEVASAISALVNGRPGRVPWVLRSRALETAGYLPGDILIVDLNAVAKSGDVVCAQAYDWSRARAATVMRVFQPPLLTASSYDPALRTPLVVDDRNVVIKGVVVASVRARIAA